MAFSLSSWFKGKPEDSTETQVENGNNSPGSPAALQPTPESLKGRTTDRVVRTVMPQSPQSAQPKVTTLRAPSARQAIALPVETSGESGESVIRTSPAVSPARKISFGGAPDPLGKTFGERPRPQVESSAPRVPVGPDLPVILEVGDFVDRLPSSLLQAGALDRQRRVEFRSSELYSDLTKGRASVPASIIYQKCADIFSRPISATEDIEVALPLQKLVEQMSTAFQTRQDQVAAENVAEIETPFLQVALEDGARLPKASGTSAGPIAAAKASATPFAVPVPPFREHHRTGQISTISPVKSTGEVNLPAMPPNGPAMGGSPAPKRPPATVRASVAGAKIRVSGSATGNRIITPVGPSAPGGPGTPGSAARPPSTQSVGPLVKGGPAASPSSPSHQVAKKTARIQIPPISLRPAGAGAKPASPAPPSAAAVPLQPSPVSVRPAPGGSSLPTFRSTPGLEGGDVAKFRSTPPPAIKPPPPSFSPRRTIQVPPASAAELPPAEAQKPAAPAPPNAPPSAALPAAAPAATDDRQIVLKLAPILRGLPALALATDPSNVPDEVTIPLPFRLIEPQLKSGRVAVPFTAFLAALPENDRGFIVGDAGLTEVPLPLQEIFLNLPSSALSIRPDQVVEEASAAYLTPFSQKAEEDAKRFDLPEPAPAGAVVGTDPVDTAPAEAETAPAEAAREPVQAAAPDQPASPLFEEFEPVAVEKPVDEPVAVAAAVSPETEEDESPLHPPEAVSALTLTEASAPEPEKTAPPVEVIAAVKPTTIAANGAGHSTRKATVTPAAETVLQTLFMTEDELDAKSVVKLVSQLPGINGCAVMFGDGLQLAGNFPENGHAEGFSAMSPPFYKRTMNFTSELKLGELQAFTIYTDIELVSFFMHDDICVSVRHAGRGFLPGVREKLETVTRELAQMYSTTPPASVN